jgi:prepilin-type N-terminal cleavage/methylation domain-containing protein
MHLSGKMPSAMRSESGFSLIELVVVIVAMGIAAAVSMQSMGEVIDDMNRIETAKEMEMLSRAIVGNPKITQDGARADFGYVGDVGAFPPNLQALYTNPGAYSTWDGPYTAADLTQDITGFKLDAWGTAYTYSGGIAIISTGGGSNMVKNVARVSNDYLLNTLRGTVTDSAGNAPDTIYMDSVEVVVTVPNGIGGTVSKIYTPVSSGQFTLDSIPAGERLLRVIYTPANDTLTRYVTIMPRHRNTKSVRFASAYFDTMSSPLGSGSEILRPNGTGTGGVYNGSGCSNNWECIDESSPDDDATYLDRIAGNASWDHETYAATNSAVDAGTIDSIVVYARAKDELIKLALRTDATLYESSPINITSSYVDYSQAWVTNPNTTVAWTWSDINAMEIGVSLKASGRATQVWMEVFYTP